LPGQQPACSVCDSRESNGLTVISCFRNACKSS